MAADHIVIVGAGAAGLMAARELARNGARVTLIEARERIGGRIWPLPEEEFGYRAEGGAEFIHGPAPVTRALAEAAGLALSSARGEAWSMRAGRLARDDDGTALPHAEELQERLAGLAADLPIARFLERYFSAARHAALRRSILRMTEGYDAADPERASTFALREEWLGGGDRQSARIRAGYGALVDVLAAECRRHGAALHLGTEIAAIATGGGKVVLRTTAGAAVEADAAIVTLPPPVLRDIALAPAQPQVAAALAEIGFGTVVKFLLRFRTRWWRSANGQDLGAMSFIFSDELVPTWWTQYPDDPAVLTGWLAGPKAAHLKLDEAALLDCGLAALARIFAVAPEAIAAQLAAARVIDWGADPYARGAYSYATPQTRAAQAVLAKPIDGVLIFSGEALYAGADMGTVEAALASGRDAATALLAGRTGTR